MRGICWMAPNAAPYTAAIITVVTIVVRRKRGANSSPKLGRLSVPWRLRCSHNGDSGRNGRMIISGSAGANPDISVYRQASWPPITAGSDSALLTIQ